MTCLRSLNDSAKQGKFYDESAGIRSVVEEVSGTSFEDFFRRYVSGLDEIPYDQFLAHAGLSLKNEFRQSADAGFLVGRSSDGPDGRCGHAGQQLRKQLACALTIFWSS